MTGSEFYKDRGGYPCSVNLNTDAGKSVTLDLSDYKDVWSLDFNVSDRASVYRQFFDSRGLRDDGAFEKMFDRVRIGGRYFSFNDTSLLEVHRQKVDNRTYAIFSVNEKHNVARAVRAMADDGIETPGLVSLDGTATVLSEFRTCSYAAMGLQEGEKVETDFRAEYRMIFEGAFENWVENMARAEQCFARRFDDEAVSEVIDAAAGAFYPGILNFFKRREYREELERTLSRRTLSGTNDAMLDGCLMAGRLADAWRDPVDRAIEEAGELD